jgi:hypothetical protein
MKQKRAPSRTHAKKHLWLSANSLLLRQDDAYSRTVSVKNVGILLASLLVAVGLTSAGWITVQRRNTPKMLPVTVKEKDFSFKATYYNGATIQTSRGTNYLVNRDKHGTETTLWVAKIDKILSCGENPTFSYSSDVGLDSHSSCYLPDHKVFVSDIIVDAQVYQINMTSPEPISTSDAKQIFSTVDILP